MGPPPSQEVGYVVVVGVWWNVIVYLLVGCAVLLALLMDFRLASGGRSKIFQELRSRMVLLWVCSGSFFPAQLPAHLVY